MTSQKLKINQRICQLILTPALNDVAWFDIHMDLIVFIDPLKSIGTVVNDGPYLAFGQFLARFNLIGDGIRSQLINHEE